MKGFVVAALAHAPIVFDGRHEREANETKEVDRYPAGQIRDVRRGKTRDAQRN